MESSEEFTLFLAREQVRGAAQGRGAWKIMEHAEQTEIQVRELAQ
jgi:hypothetical protein